MTSPDQKLRLRTDEELENQRKGLEELADLLESAGVSFYLCSGTLLGAVREKNFIRWDWDVQFYLRTEDVFHRKKDLLGLFKANGFKIKKYNPTYRDLKYSLLKYGANYELTAWRRKKNMRYRKYYQLPARFFEDTQTIEFLGRKYPCVTPAEEYLEYCYGDWREPRRDSDKQSYHHARFFRYTGWRKKVYDLGEWVRSKGRLGSDGTMKK